jgi:hypothetical protein
VPGDRADMPGAWRNGTLHEGSEVSSREVTYVRRAYAAASEALPPQRAGPRREGMPHRAGCPVTGESWAIVAWFAVCLAAAIVWLFARTGRPGRRDTTYYSYHWYRPRRIRRRR